MRNQIDMVQRHFQKKIPMRYYGSYFDLEVPNRTIRIYTNEGFHKLSTLPNENTLEVNVTSHQLSDLSTAFRKQTAIAPTRVEEGGDKRTGTPLGKGYDIKLETAKEVVFQHKKPLKARVRGPEDHHWLFFKLNMEQIYTLVLQYAPGEAFLALPAVPQQTHMPEALTRTVFVDVWTIFLHRLTHDKKTRYLIVEYRPIAEQTPHVIGKFATSAYAMEDLNTEPYYQISERDDQSSIGVYSWKDIKEHIERCDFGLPIRGVRERGIFESIELDPAAYPGEFDELPENYESIEELLSEFDPDYRDHIRRKFTINGYNKTEDLDRIGTYENQLLDSLKQRARMGKEEERTSLPWDYQTPENDELILEEVIEPRRDMNNPLTKGLSGNCRYVLEDGCLNTSLTI